MMTVQNVAVICHEANKVLCEQQGDFSQLNWADAPEWQKESAVHGVKFHLSTPEAKASASHDSWMKEKVDAGWVYGEVKDANLKTHPCIVPFEQLPPEQQVKDVLFKNIVEAFRGFIVEGQC